MTAPKLSPELLEQIQKVLNPTGPFSPQLNPKPTPGSEQEQHLPMQPRKEKKAALGSMLGKLAPAGSSLGEHLAKHDHLYDLAGLGVLAAPSAANLVHEARSAPGTRDRRAVAKDVTELGGLGLLAAPVAAAAMGFKHASVLDELEKLGFVSDDEAARALQSLQDLESSKPSLKQTAGYAGLGALATPAIHAVGNVIRKRSPFEGVNLGDRLRDAGAQAFKGGLGGTAVSIGQQQIDRHHNVGKLRAYVKEHDAEKTGAEADAIPPPPDSHGNVLNFPKPGWLPAIEQGHQKKLHESDGKVHHLATKPPEKKKVAALGAVAPAIAKAPAVRGLAGSGTPAMPLPKVAGILDSVKALALKDVGGPKGLLQPARTAAELGKKKQVPLVRAQSLGSSHDVSGMAAQMGL